MSPHPIPASLALPRCREEVAAGMFAVEVPNKQGLAAHYPFRPDTLEQMQDGRVRAKLRLL